MLASVDALLYRTVHDEPDLDGVPDETRTLLERCLAKDPSARPTAREVDETLVEDTPHDTAGWLPDAVVRLVADRSAAMLALPDIEATALDATALDATADEQPTGVPMGAPPPTSRRRLLLLGGGAALLAAGGGAALWPHSATTAPRRPPRPASAAGPSASRPT